MPSPLIPAGPYATLATATGVPFPYYIIPFDKDGRCVGPRTRQHLLDNLAGVSDVFVFSHGWNNDWTAATERYEHFIRGFQEQQKTFGLAQPAGYRPLLVGIFWPSQSMAWFDSETGPGFAAGGDPRERAAEVEAARAQVDDIAAMLPEAQRERFFELVQAGELAEADARELANMLVPLMAPDDEGVATREATADDLLAAAGSLGAGEPEDDAVGTVGGDAGGPRHAGAGDFFAKLDPRNLIKPFTVWQMKDRAGKVGARGVGKLLEGILAASDARVHLLGHSYGCKVVMSATAALPDGARQLHSALLLQPAISQYAFASSLPEQPGASGGYRRNLQRIKGPVVATFSARDNPLTRTFHLALRRKADLGEQPLHAGASPSIYGALGGFGPQDSGQTVVDIVDPVQPYDLAPGGRIIGVRGTRTISGHGDISNPSTWWLAHSVATLAV